MYHPVEVSEISRPVVGTSLQRTLREQQTLLDSAGVGIVFIRNRIVVHCNQRYAEIYGYASPQELLGWGIRHWDATRIPRTLTLAEAQLH